MSEEKNAAGPETPADPEKKKKKKRGNGSFYVPRTFRAWVWIWLFLMMCVALYGYIRYAHDGWTPDHLLQLIPFISGA